MNTQSEEDDFGEWLEDIEVKDIDALKPKHKEAPEVRHPCGQCHGTGKYQGHRTVQTRSDCFACKGKGYFLTSARDRANAKASRKRSKQSKKDKFILANQAVCEWVAVNRDWNNFAASLYTQLDTKGGWTDPQLAAITRTMEKTEAGRIQRAKEKAEREADAPVFDLARIHQLFDKALDNGLNRRALRMGELKITPAGPRSSYPGYLFVKDNDDYAGKIDTAGKWLPIRSAREGIAEELEALAADPMKEARLYGQRTGSCCCCGRELTNPASIEAGIGPICADNWGF